MGVSYRRFEGIRRLIIATFPDNPIIIFPQTIDYPETFYGIRELKQAAKVYSKAHNLILTAREEKSYITMKSCFFNAAVYKIPDIVLWLDYRNISEKRKGIRCCLRKGKEKIISTLTEDKIEKYFPDATPITTGVSSALIITEKNRQLILEDRLHEFANSKLIVTDRLHAMIFSYITNTPCIALPNSNGKVKGVYSWIQRNGSVLYLEENELDMIEIPSQKENAILRNEFDEFRNAILRKIQ